MLFVGEEFIFIFLSIGLLSLVLIELSLNFLPTDFSLLGLTLAFNTFKVPVCIDVNGGVHDGSAIKYALLGV